MPPGGLHALCTSARSEKSDKSTRNREEIARALLLFETWLLDAYEKHDFHGDVIVKATFADAKMVMLYPAMEQKVRV